MLAIFDPAKPSLVYVDTSQSGISTMLKQADSCGMEHPLAHYSRKLLPHEQNYSATEMKCLAIVDAVDKWHCYSHVHKFSVITVHAALKWLKTIGNPSDRLFRWSLRLSVYDLDIQHLKGLENVEADALSSFPAVNLLDIADSRQAQQELPRDQPNVGVENNISVVGKKVC